MDQHQVVHGDTLLDSSGPTSGNYSKLSSCIVNVYPACQQALGPSLHRSIVGRFGCGIVKTFKPQQDAHVKNMYILLMLTPFKISLPTST